MLAVLPIITLIILFLLSNKPPRDWRESYLASVLILGSLFAISSEAFSLVNSLNFTTILGFWLLINTGLISYYYRRLCRHQQVIPRLSMEGLTISSRLTIASIIAIVFLVGLVAVIAPPNNWDSMTYHMVRVMHWIQQRNLSHYPTYYSAQLVHPPLAEIIIMHLQILSGGDRFANLVQWLAMLSNIIGVSLIAKQLGAKQQGQLLAAVFSATLPMAILQGSSTQNDCVVAFWLVCLVHYVLQLVSSQSISLPVILAIGSSLGLALFTKSSAYFLSVSFLVWVILYLGFLKRKKAGKYLILIFVLALLFNWGHYLRNIEVFGAPISAADYKQENQAEVYSLPTLLSNIIRHLSMHVDIVRYLHLQSWLVPITGKVENLVYLIHQYILKLDPSDPRITMPGYTYKVPGISFNEDVAVNPLHYFLILIAIILFISHKRLRRNKIIVCYLASLIGGFVIFCLLLKLQPFSVRHHLSFFVLFSPFVGITYTSFARANLTKIIILILLITCIPWLFNNSGRPLVGENNILGIPKNDIYFLQRKHLKDAYYEAAKVIANQECSNIGLSLGWDKRYTGHLWEYPFWPIITATNPARNYRFSHFVNPDNSTAKLMNKSPNKEFDYCLFIAVRSNKEIVAKHLKINNKSFSEGWSKPPVSILFPD